MKNSTIYIILAVILVALSIWYFFIRKKPLEKCSLLQAALLVTDSNTYGANSGNTTGGILTNKLTGEQVCELL